eukprot:gene25868-biopygen3031
MPSQPAFCPRKASPPPPPPGGSSSIGLEAPWRRWWGEALRGQEAADGLGVADRRGERRGALARRSRPLVSLLSLHGAICWVLGGGVPPARVHGAICCTSLHLEKSWEDTTPAASQGGFSGPDGAAGDQPCPPPPPPRRASNPIELLPPGGGGGGTPCEDRRLRVGPIDLLPPGLGVADRRGERRGALARRSRPLVSLLSLQRPLAPRRSPLLSADPSPPAASCPRKASFPPPPPGGSGSPGGGGRPGRPDRPGRASGPRDVYPVHRKLSWEHARSAIADWAGVDQVGHGWVRPGISRINAAHAAHAGHLVQISGGSQGGPGGDPVVDQKS